MAAVSRTWLRELAEPTSRLMHEAEHALRTSWLPEAGAYVQRTHARLPKGVALLFFGSVLTGAVYGLSGSAAQTLTTGVSALTLWLVFSVREAQQQEALALRRSLEELRASLRVTQALLEASELQGAEELRNSRLPPASASVEARATAREQDGEARATAREQDGEARATAREQDDDDETRRISLSTISVG
jgi:hypothetical protein